MGAHPRRAATRNQLATQTGTYLVDWESAKLAPRERDLATLVEHGWGHLVDADPTLLEMFDLEWRLDEISHYAAWFRLPTPATTATRSPWPGCTTKSKRDPRDNSCRT